MLVETAHASYDMIEHQFVVLRRDYSLGRSIKQAHSPRIAAGWKPCVTDDKDKALRSKLKYVLIRTEGLLDPNRHAIVDTASSSTFIG